MARIRAHSEILDRDEAEHFGFGINDKYGRPIGAYIYRWTIKFTPAPEGATYWTNVEALGMKYAFSPQATRNGKNYGALQADRYFETKAERDAAIARYLKNARQRAGKLAA